MFPRPFARCRLAASNTQVIYDLTTTARTNNSPLAVGAIALSNPAHCMCENATFYTRVAYIKSKVSGSAVTGPLFRPLPSDNFHISIIHFAPKRVQSIAMIMLVRLFVCVSARIYQKLHKFCTCWPWLGPPLVALSTSGFADDIMCSHNGRYGASWVFLGDEKLSKQPKLFQSNYFAQR